MAIGGDYVAALGAHLVLPCSAVGDSPLQTTWYHNGNQLKDQLTYNPIKSKTLTEATQPWIANWPFRRVAEETVFDVLANGSLLISSLPDSGGGNYTCQVFSFLLFFFLILDYVL